MQRHRRPSARRAGILFLLALLFIPVVLRGHQHANHMANAHPCAVCVVAKHSPVVGTPVFAALTPLFQSVAAPPARAARPAWIERLAATGRGPPRPALLRSV